MTLSRSYTNGIIGSVPWLRDSLGAFKMTLRLSRRTKPLAFGALLAVMLGVSLAVAADATPIDKASGQVSEAITLLKDLKLGNKDSDDHLEKARTYLARARAEMLKAQSQSTSE
jgi:hypothetical protein